MKTYTGTFSDSKLTLTLACVLSGEASNTKFKVLAGHVRGEHATKRPVMRFGQDGFLVIVYYVSFKHSNIYYC